MRASQIAVRTALVLGAAGAGVALWSAVDDTAAYAADHQPAAHADHPRGLLEHVLPEQAADRAREAVDQVLPEPAPEPQREEPADPAPAEPETPAAEPTEPATDPIVEVPPIEVPPVVEVPPVPVPVVVEPPPVVEPAPVVITLPSVDPAPLPDAGDLLPVQVPAAPPLPLVAPLDLPGLAPATAPLAAASHDHPAQAAAVVDVAVCDDDTQADPLDMAAPAKRIKRIHPRVAHLAAPGRAPCAPDGGQDLAAHLAGVAAPSQSGGGQLVATVPAGAGLPAVTERLGQLLPRSDLPSSRTTHLDPRPA